MILHQRVINEGQHHLLFRQDREERLVRSPPEASIRLMGESEDLTQREPLETPVALQWETEARRQLGEQAAEGPRAGVVPLAQQPLLWLREGVRPHAPRLAEEVAVPFQHGMPDEPVGRLVREPQPLQLEEEDEVPDLRQGKLDPLAKVSVLGPGRVRGIQEPGIGPHPLQLPLQHLHFQDGRQQMLRGGSPESVDGPPVPAREGFRARPAARERGLDGRIEGGSEQIAEIPPDPDRIVGLTAHARLLSRGREDCGDGFPDAPPEAVF